MEEQILAKILYEIEGIKVNVAELKKKMDAIEESVGDMNEKIK